ncbi:hypothetical protein [Glutamicibacter sp. TV12E]|uniref:hypothetical protein n=1 Tax=Glutamicibacter sp. TV12E TaxID=3446362 RepID=UPI00403390EF
MQEEADPPEMRREKIEKRESTISVLLLTAFAIGAIFLMIVLLIVGEGKFSSKFVDFLFIYTGATFIVWAGHKWIPRIQITKDSDH